MIDNFNRKTSIHFRFIVFPEIYFLGKVKVQYV